MYKVCDPQNSGGWCCQLKDAQMEDGNLEGKSIPWRVMWLSPPQPKGASSRALCMIDKLHLTFDFEFEVPRNVFKRSLQYLLKGHLNVTGQA